jgi:hypothetical protein
VIFDRASAPEIFTRRREGAKKARVVRATTQRRDEAGPFGGVSRSSKIGLAGKRSLLKAARAASHTRCVVASLREQIPSAFAPSGEQDRVQPR